MNIEYRYDWRISSVERERRSHLFRAAFQINYSSNMVRNIFRILRGHDDFGQLGYSGEEIAEQAASSNL
jgi:hypothetical protein